VFPLRDDNPTFRVPYATYGLIAANVAAWVLLQGLGTEPALSASVLGLGLVPATASWHNVVTSMFLHGGWLHLIGNMWFLWIFGNNVEDALGKIRFFFWYLAAGVAATALQTFVTLSFGTVRDASIPNIGASGAIAGVLGAYFLLLPRARVLTVIFFGLIFLREIPAVWFLGIWILLQAWQGGIGLTHPDQTGGVAVFAHIGGFAFGLLTVFLVAKRRPLQPTYR
jgi:membrane associated rhomboid family serine protease